MSVVNDILRAHTSPLTCDKTIFHWTETDVEKRGDREIGGDPNLII